jgi:hypothetical protein
MAVLSFIYRYGIWISIPAFIVFVVLLILCILITSAASVGCTP